MQEKSDGTKWKPYFELEYPGNDQIYNAVKYETFLKFDYFWIGSGLDIYVYIPLARKSFWVFSKILASKQLTMVMKKKGLKAEL